MTMTVTVTTECTIVPTGAVHGRRFNPGETTSDPFVCEVLLRNKWGTRESAAGSPAAAAAAVASASASAPSAPAADPKPVAVKARKAAPENK